LLRLLFSEEGGRRCEVDGVVGHNLKETVPLSRNTVLRRQMYLVLLGVAVSVLI
jgi:hypothetical protein